MNCRLGVRRFFIICACLLLGFIAAPLALHGQLLHGTINGNVTDPSGAAVGDAKVVATDQDTKFTREGVSNSSGVYTLPDLPPGTYTVTFTQTGFQTYIRRGAEVQAQTVTRVDVVLTIGSVSENVTVSANAVGLQTDRADVRSELGKDLLNNVPVPIGRNYQMLFVALPGVSPPQNSHSFSANSTRSLMFSVNGGSVTTNDTRVDGAGTRNFSATDVIQYVPAMEAVETVNVASSSLDADQSSGAGFINVTVKNGTNTLHGSLFEDHADRSLAAYQWVANRTLPKLPYINNQFGGTIGGPIKKDKVFYFVSYEGTRLVQGNAVVAQVPTAAMKSGDLSGSPTPIYDPVSGNASGGGRTAFPGNIIPASRIDPGVQAMLATGSWPNPNRPGTGAFGLGQDFLCTGCQGNSGARRDQVDGKVSWNPSTKLSTFARIGINDNYWYDPQIFGLVGGPTVSPSNGSVGIGGAKVFNGTISGTYVFSPNLVFDAYFGYDRNDMYSKQPNQAKNLGWTLLQIPGLNTSNLPQNKQLQQGGMPLLAIDGFASLGPANIYQPQSYHDPERNYNVNANWMKGTHNVRAGFDADLQDSNEMQYQITGSSYIANSGGFHFTQGTTQLQGGPGGNDFNAFASFLVGVAQDSGKIYQFPDEYTTRSRILSFYIRDRWQATPRLTVSYGVRYEYFPFPRRVGSGLEFYNPASGTMSICGIGSTPVDCGITRDRQHLTPRFGLAYRVTDSTVIRAGYSMATDPNFFITGSFSVDGRLNYPYIFGQLLLPPNSLSYATTLRQGLPAVAPPNVSSGVVPVPGLAAVTTYDNSNYVRGYVQTWNFTVEQRVSNWLASAGYVGSRAIDPQDTLEMNWSGINGGAAGQILNQMTGRTASTLFVGTMGTNTYDSLQARTQGHFSWGQIGTTYTFGKALGYAPINAMLKIPQYFGLNRGPVTTDIRHMFALTGVFDLPFGKGKHWAQTGVASKVAGGWQISTVVTAHTGLPFTATASNSTLNAQFSSQFADCLSAPQEIGSILGWYNKSSFAAPGAGRFGTCGTNSLRGPGLINVDGGVQRLFKLTEKVAMTFRAEMFNTANTPHHSLPVGNVSTSTFMQATGILGTGREGVEQRALRLALRLSF
jgi:hypothetical protein